MLECDKSNFGSAETIQALSGELEKEYYNKESNEIVQVYWIDVNKSIKNNKNIFEQFISKAEVID